MAAAGPATPASTALEDVTLDERLAELGRSRVVFGQLLTVHDADRTRLCLVCHKSYRDKVLAVLEADTRMSRHEGAKSSKGGFYTYKLKLINKTKVEERKQVEMKREVFKEVIDMAEKVGVDVSGLQTSRGLTRDKTKLAIKNMTALEQDMLECRGGTTSSAPVEQGGMGITELVSMASGVASGAAAGAAAPSSPPAEQGGTGITSLSASRSRGNPARLWHRRTTWKCKTHSRSGPRPRDASMKMAAREAHDLHLLEVFATKAFELARMARAQGKPFGGSRGHGSTFFDDELNKKMVFASLWIPGYELMAENVKCSATVDIQALHRLRSELKQHGENLVEGFKWLRKEAHRTCNFGEVPPAEQEQPAEQQQQPTEQQAGAADPVARMELLEKSAKHAANCGTKLFELLFESKWTELVGGPGPLGETKLKGYFMMSMRRCRRRLDGGQPCNAAVHIVEFANSSLVSIEVAVSSGHFATCWTALEKRKSASKDGFCEHGAAQAPQAPQNPIAQQSQNGVHTQGMLPRHDPTPCPTALDQVVQLGDLVVRRMAAVRDRATDAQAGALIECFKKAEKLLAAIEGTGSRASIPQDPGATASNNPGRMPDRCSTPRVRRMPRKESNRNNKRSRSSSISNEEDHAEAH